MQNTTFALLAGGLGTRMMRLGLPKPLVPFGGVVRLIDFSVQNVRRSGGRQLFIMVNSYRRAIAEALLASYPPTTDFSLHFGPWNDLYDEVGLSALDRPAPFQERGTADALVTFRKNIENTGARDLFVLHSDHVYDFDYRPMLKLHREKNAILTIGYQQIEHRYVSLFGMAAFDSNGYLTRFVEKPKNPSHDTVFTAVAVFRVDALYDIIDSFKGSEWNHDISRDIIPRMLDRGDRILGFPFLDYWSDIGTLERYYSSQLAYLRERKGPCLDSMTATLDRCHRVSETRSLIAPSATILGSVEDSVVCGNASISRHGRVLRSVVFPGAVVLGEVSDSIVKSGEIVTTRHGLDSLSMSEPDPMSARDTQYLAIPDA